MPRGIQSSPPIVRFEAGIDRNGPVPAHRPELGPCWLWKLSVSGGDNQGNGYGRFMVDGRLVAVHRWAYRYWVGPIPEGLELDHLCRVRRCCNPAHLEPVTRRENLLRGQTLAAKEATTTHCPRGHAYDEANTNIRPHGGRQCRKCIVIRVRAWRQRKKAAPAPST